MVRTVSLSLLFPLFWGLLSVSLSASDEVWTPQRVPATGTVPFIMYYQQFLRTNPFDIKAEPTTPEEKAENRRLHQRAAELYAEMSKVAETLAKSGDLLPTAPTNIEKKEPQRIKGSRNLYPHVPINAADLLEEAMYMRYRALSHETSLDAGKIAALHDFVAELEKETDLPELFQDLKRSVCLRALSFVHRPLKRYIDKEETTLPDELELGEKFVVAVQWFAPFLQKHPSEKNMETVNPFLGTLDLFRSHYPDSEHSAVIAEQFRKVFADIHLQSVEPLIKEYAVIYEGVLRRQELLGEPMPIWGTDLTGKAFDEKTLEGKVVLLDFWATWCGPCVAEFPHLKLLYQKYKEKGFEIVGYSVDADQERLRTYLTQNPLPWIMLSKETSEQAGQPPLSLYYGAKALPVVLLRDRSGKAVLLDARGEKLDDMLEKLFDTLF